MAFPQITLINTDLFLSRYRNAYNSVLIRVICGKA
jgi:hypothetical protein